MAQQINLSTPILLAQKRYFSAHTMLVALGVFVLLGGVLTGAWVWNFQRGTDALLQSARAQESELVRLRAAITQSKANAQPVAPALMAQLQQLRETLARREQLEVALQEGLLVPGAAHSDRLRWIARSIPDPVWVSALRMEAGRLEIEGYTQESAALNLWVQRLSQHPLTENLKLATVRVQHVAPEPRTALVGPGAGASASTASAGVWSYSLVSVAALAKGGQP